MAMKIDDLDLLATGTMSDEIRLRNRAYWASLQSKEFYALHFYLKWGGTMREEASKYFVNLKLSMSKIEAALRPFQDRPRDEMENRRLIWLLTPDLKKYGVKPVQFVEGYSSWVGDQLYLNQGTQDSLWGLPYIHSGGFGRIVPHWASRNRNTLDVSGLRLTENGIDYYRVGLVRDHAGRNWEEGKWEYRYTTERRSQ